MPNILMIVLAVRDGTILETAAGPRRGQRIHGLCWEQETAVLLDLLTTGVFGRVMQAPDDTEWYAMPVQDFWKNGFQPEQATRLC